MSSDEIHALRIDRSLPRAPQRRSPIRLAAGAVVTLVLAAAAFTVYGLITSATPVDVMRVVPPASAAARGQDPILQATGYIVAAHRIEVGSKVAGRVAWVGVEKGDLVKAGQVLVRLEDQADRAQLAQARGRLASLEARVAELTGGSRPEEIEMARANLAEAEAELHSAQVTLERVRALSAEGILAKQALDDARARHDSLRARVQSLRKMQDLVVLGPRQEQLDAARGQMAESRAAVDYAATQLANTVIRAPVSGTVLERAVEKGEFVTTSFAGERGAKSYVAAVADLTDLEVELDIGQSDFAKVRSAGRALISTDAFPDRRYEGVIARIAPEANRQKATVQISVKVTNADEFLRPEMNASVAFLPSGPTTGSAVRLDSTPAVITVPATAVRDDSVFVIVDGRAIRKPVRVGTPGPDGVQITKGLVGGEDLISNPPRGLKEGQRVCPNP
jgi:HlyD family secretion protein